MTRSKDDQLRWYDVDVSLSQSGDFVIINKTLIIIRSITGESTKNSKKKILLILADFITSDIVLNNKLFNTRSITLIYIIIRKRSISWCSFTNNDMDW